jgi:diphosphomevalonate decarboxylase
MTHATAIAHPNIALVKYWGKRNVRLNLPAVSSLSLTLSHYRTQTEVRWDAPRDVVTLNGHPPSKAQAARVFAFLDRIDGARPPCAVHSDNNFPAGAGLASSASGFAALALAATTAAGQALDLTALSVLARQGSGSACRSLWGGFVEWRRGEEEDGTDSHGIPLEGADDWDIAMVAAVVHEGPKPVGSTAGMERSRETSPYYGEWVQGADADLQEAKAAIRARDLQRLGEVMESSTYKMHATMHTSRPPLLYWHPGTVQILHEVASMRADGLGAWSTMDAGPQVKVLCARTDAPQIARRLTPHATRVDVLVPGGPARLVP